MKKYFSYVVIFIFSFNLVSCAPKSEDRNYTQQLHTHASSSNIISFPCAIMLAPTSKFIDSLKNIDDENIKIELAEIFSYQKEAKKYFDTHKIKTISKISEGNLKFQTSQNSDTIINLAGFYWSILLFNGKNSPIHMGRSDFEIEVDSYMNIGK